MHSGTEAELSVARGNAEPQPAVDILILSNGPGEISTWVRPVVRSLRQRQRDPAQLRISIVLSPCANASGREAEIARALPGVDRVQGPADFFRFLLLGQTAESWTWANQGAVLFLGGDQIYPVLLGRRLGYRTIVYAEWEARWHRWIDRFGTMKPEIGQQARPEYQPKFTVVGDLMADVDGRSPLPAPLLSALGLESTAGAASPGEIIGLMPGSKKDKLELGVPLSLAVADKIRQARPQTRFVILVAPLLPLTTLAAYADRAHNAAAIELVDGATATLVHQGEIALLKTASGTEIYLWQGHPAYDVMGQFSLCLTTIGANTAELGSLAVPMLVLLPTQKLDAMKAWDGLPGILANLPLVGSPLARLINRLALKTILKEGRLFAWPNLWAKRQIVPELIGQITPQQVSDRVLDYLAHPETLEAMRQELQAVRGQPGAAAKLADLVLEAVDYRQVPGVRA